MFGLPPTAVEWLGVGALLTGLGYLIRFREWTFLLAGYDRTSPVPDEVAADVAGSTVLRIGLAALAIGTTAAFTDLPSSLPLVFEAAVLLAVARLLYRLRTYAPADAT